MLACCWWVAWSVPSRAKYRSAVNWASMRFNHKAGELGSRRSCQALFSAWCRGFAGAGYGGDQAGDGRAAGGPAWGGLVPARQGGFDLAGTDAGAAWREQVA